MKKFRLSDLITNSRIIGVGIFAIVVSYYPNFFGLVPGILIILLLILTDSLDGIVARKFDEESEFGSFYDIVGDRIAEIVFLLPYLKLDIISTVFPMYFIIKGFLVDYQRMYRYVRLGKVPFKQVKSKLSKFLVSSRIMRSSYGFLKTLMIVLFYVNIFKTGELFSKSATIVAIVTIVVSLFRTIPVFFVKRGKNKKEK